MPQSFCFGSSARQNLLFASNFVIQGKINEKNKFNNYFFGGDKFNICF